MTLSFTSAMHGSWTSSSSKHLFLCLTAFFDPPSPSPPTPHPTVCPEFQTGWKCKEFKCPEQPSTDEGRKLV